MVPAASSDHGGTAACTSCPGAIAAGWSRTSVSVATRIHAREVNGVAEEDAVPVPLAAGGLSIHESRTLHYAGPNLSAGPRWSYALAFKRRRDWLHGWRFGPLLRDPLAGLIRTG